MAGLNKKNQNTQELATFDTVPMGFKKTQVNLYINSLKKQIISYEEQVKADKEKIAQLSEAIKNDSTEQYEQRIQELNNVLNKERQGIENAESNSQRLQKEIDKLKTLLDEKNAALEAAENTIKELSDNVSFKNSNPIMNEFLIEDDSLSESGLIIEEAESPIIDDDLMEIVNEDFASAENDLSIEVDDSFFVLPKRHSENAIDFGISDDFSGLLGDSSEDLIISNQDGIDKGDDLIINSSVSTDRGSDLTSIELQGSSGGSSRKISPSKNTKKNR